MANLMDKKLSKNGNAGSGGGDSTMASSLRVNNLFYKLPRSLSVAVQRSSIKCYPQKSDFKGGQTIVSDWNTGTSYIDTNNSYFSFGMKSVLVAAGTPGTASAGFGAGSVINIFNQIKVQSRSGTEISREEKVNQFSLMCTKWKYSTGFLDGFGSVIGYGSGTTAIVDDVVTQFCIPLRLISGIFNPLRSRLMPSQLASGLHCTILLENFNRALITTTNFVVGYEISNVYWSLNAVTLMDSVLRTLNSESSANGLEYVYERTFTSENQIPQGQVKSNIQVNKAVSFANNLWAIETKNDNATDVKLDSFINVPYAYTFIRVRSGSSYYPTDGIRGSTADLTAPIAFIETQQSFDKMRKMAFDNSVSLATFKTGAQGTGCVGVSLEKDTSLSLSGTPVNNSRLIEIELEREAGTADPSTVTLFLTYTSLIRVYLNNVSSKI